MARDFIVHIEGERAAFWRQHLGTDDLCVMSPVPQLVNLPGKPRARCFFLDLELLTNEQRAGLVRGIAERFELDEAYVSANLDREGVPVLVEDCVLVVQNPARWLP